MPTSLQNSGQDTSSKRKLPHNISIPRPEAQTVDQRRQEECRTPNHRYNMQRQEGSMDTHQSPRTSRARHETQQQAGASSMRHLRLRLLLQPNQLSLRRSHHLP